MEVVMGLLFVGVHLAISADMGWYFPIDRIYGSRLLMGTMLVSFLVVATMMDYDWMIITDSVTIPGMLIGLTLGTIMPYARPVPMKSTSNLTGLWVGVVGILIGFGLILFFRVLGRILFRREAMGLGDATLMGVIGAFLGWKAAILTFFIAPFFGLAHAVWKLGQMIVRRLTGRQIRQADHEMPFGPYLSMAAIFCLLGWPWIWKNWAIDLFESFSMILK
jgi:leader peptidase (prepilin peptidase)/N-methyltransferase